jgi:hypothetical protein
MTQFLAIVNKLKFDKRAMEEVEKVLWNYVVSICINKEGKHLLEKI